MAGGQKRDSQYVEALLTKRIEFVKKFKSDLTANNSTIAQTIAAYSELLEGDRDLMLSLLSHSEAVLDAKQLLYESLQFKK